MLWHAGQQLRVLVQGYDSSYMDNLMPGMKLFNFHTRNKGDQIIHTGGKYDSHLLVPVIPR
jgi:predicted acyl esterase